MSPNPYSEFKLTDKEHQQISQDIVSTRLSDAQSVDTPKAILVAGQPGAGKSSIAAQSKSELANHGGSVVIDIDDLRELHPNYIEYQTSNNREAAGMVQYDAGKWGRQLIQEAIKQKKNVVIDGTLMLPDVAKKLSKQFKKAGYDIDVRAMAVPAEDSKLSIYERYEGKKTSGKPGRWVPLEIHEKAYSGMAKSIELLNKEKLVDNIEVHGRSSNGHIETRVLYAEKAGAGDPVKFLNDERSRPKNHKEQQDFKSLTSHVSQQIYNRDPNLSEPENRAFIENVRANYPDLLPKQQQSVKNEATLKLSRENTNNAFGAQPKIDIKAALATAKQAVVENGSVINKELDKIQNEKALEQKPKQENVKRPSRDPEFER